VAKRGNKLPKGALYVGWVGYIGRDAKSAQLVGGALDRAGRATRNSNFGPMLNQQFGRSVADTERAASNKEGGILKLHTISFLRKTMVESFR
jgi:hypothetical protein